MASLAAFIKDSSSSPKNQNALHIRYIDYQNLEESAYQYRDLTEESVRHLADLIFLDGKVLEPLIVRRKEKDRFEILSGHKRYRACKLLVEADQEESFRMLPCCVLDLDNIHAEFAVYSTNGYDQKTPYEITQEIDGLKRLITSHPDMFPHPKGVRTVDMIAEELHISSTTVKVHQAISNRLSDDGMEQYKEGKISKEAAYELSKLPEESQKKMLDNGVTIAKDIRKKAEEKMKIEENKAPEEIEESEGLIDPDDLPIPGQMDISDYLPDEEKDNRVVKPFFDKIPVLHDWLGDCPACGQRLKRSTNENFCGTCGCRVKWIVPKSTLPFS